MKPVSDRDLMLLESYLDDELSADGVDALRERLIDEPDLAAALATLREARACRQRVFQAIEPRELEVGDCVGRMQRAAASRLAWSRRSREGLRYVAAAACVTIGVMIGSKATQPAAPSVGPSGGIAQSQPTDRLMPVMPDPFGDDPGPAMPVQFDQPLHPVLPAATPRLVVLRDARGNIVAANEFRTAAEAREFVDDLRRAAAASGHAIVPAPRPDAVAPLPPPPSVRDRAFVSTPSAIGGGQVVPVSAEQF